MATLDGRDGRARDPYLIGQTLLCPALVLTEEPKVQAGAGEVHRRKCGDIESPTTWRGIIGPCVRSREPGSTGDGAAQRVCDDVTTSDLAPRCLKAMSRYHRGS